MGDTNLVLLRSMILALGMNLVVDTSLVVLADTSLVVVTNLGVHLLLLDHTNLVAVDTNLGVHLLLLDHTNLVVVDTNLGCLTILRVDTSLVVVVIIRARHQRMITLLQREDLLPRQLTTRIRREEGEDELNLGVGVDDRCNTLLGLTF